MGSRTTVVRPARSGDLSALYGISLATGAAGGDASAFYQDRRLIGHIYLGPYALLNPEIAFVAEDADGVAGYSVGAFDTGEFEDRLERSWWPNLREVYTEPPTGGARWTPDQSRAYAIHHPQTTPTWVTSGYPAHLHMNLLPRLQRQGVGSQLLQMWLVAARDAAVQGVHVGCNAANERAIGFWQAKQFVVLPPPQAPSGSTIWLGRRL